jgi:ubiquinone/menaquinone biosynthesis C-methylase UbiE
MDGGGREGWWDEFKAASELMGHSGRISGVRASASSIPFGGACFDVVASVHSIRNFNSKHEVQTFFREVPRLLREGGRLVVVESSVGHARFPAYNAFYSMRTRLGWELALPSISEMVRWLRGSGFSKTTCTSFETNLEYAPITFPFDPASMEDIKEEYGAAKRLLLQQGDRHPPIDIISAAR